MQWLALDNLDQSHWVFETTTQTTLAILAILVVFYLVVRRWRQGTSSETAVKYGWGFAGKLIYLGFVFCVGVLGLTAFVSVLNVGAMQGWWLLAHLVGAGGFIVVLTLMAWTLSFRFVFIDPRGNSGDGQTKSFPLAVKLIYWVMMLLCIPLIGVILLSMFPLFGTEQMQQLINVHRYSGLALCATAVLHFLLVWFPPR